MKELTNYRDYMVGHRDKKERIVFPQGWIELQNKTAKLIPIKKLIQDVHNYFSMIEYEM